MSAFQGDDNDNDDYDNDDGDDDVIRDKSECDLLIVIGSSLKVLRPVLIINKK